MTPLRQRMIEDMQLRNLMPATQRNYVQHVAALARYYQLSPEHLDLEDLLQYELYLLNERKLAPDTINGYVSAVKFLYQITLEMPWPDAVFPRVRRPRTLPVVLSQEEVVQFFDHIPSLKRSEEHTSELQSPDHLVCRLLLEKKKTTKLTPDH